jgi:hypothetical protein
MSLSQHNLQLYLQQRVLFHLHCLKSWLIAEAMIPAIPLNARSMHEWSSRHKQRIRVRKAVLLDYSGQLVRLPCEVERIGVLHLVSHPVSYVSTYRLPFPK